jgi:hypothetical protein
MAASRVLPGIQDRKKRVPIPWPLLSIGLVLLLWGLSLDNIDLRRMKDLGLISVLHPTFFVAFFLLTVSFSLVVNQRPVRAWILLLHLVVLIFMLHGTPALLYETLRYAWAWKHVGVVDYIQRHGSVSPTVTYFSAYHNWPGFFALSAFITEVAGFESALGFANWAPVFFNLLNLGGLLLIIKSLTRDQRLLWLSVWFFFLANWVGQDYFSPQALSYFLYLVVLGICLAWFRGAALTPKVAITKWRPIDRVAWLLPKPLGPVSSSDPVDRQTQPLARAGLMLILLLLLGVIVFSHQLTPLMAVFALTALVVFQHLSARSLPILVAVLIATWISYMAAGFLKDSSGTVIETIGRLFSNVDSNLIDTFQVSPGQAWVAIIGRGLTAFMGILALFAGIGRLCCGYWDLTAILLLIAPFTALGLSSYEGEMVFRVYLFALPFMAFFAAAVVYPSPISGTSLTTAAISVLLSSMLLGGFFFAYYGKERLYHFTKNEFEAAQYLYNTAPKGSLLIEGTRNYPSRFKNYEIFTYLTIADEPEAAKRRLIDHPVDNFSRWMHNDRYAATYLIITRSQKAEVDALGAMPPGSLDLIEQALKASPEFKVIYSNEDASIFILNDQHLGAPP